MLESLKVCRKPVAGPKIDWGAWALARFCAPWVSNAGEKEKNALPKRRQAFDARSLGTTGRSWQAAKAFFSFSPGNSFAVQEARQSPQPRPAAIQGFFIDVPL